MYQSYSSNQSIHPQDDNNLRTRPLVFITLPGKENPWISDNKRPNKQIQKKHDDTLPIVMVME